MGLAVRPALEDDQHSGRVARDFLQDSSEALAPNEYLLLFDGTIEGGVWPILCGHYATFWRKPQNKYQDDDHFHSCAKVVCPPGYDRQHRSEQNMRLLAFDCPEEWTPGNPPGNVPRVMTAKASCDQTQGIVWKTNLDVTEEIKTEAMLEK